MSKQMLEENVKEIQLLNFWFDIVEPTDVHLGEAFDR